MNTERFYNYWLCVASAVIILTGFAVAFLVDPAVLPVAQTVLARWLLGLLGATMIGWGTTVLLVSRYAFAHRAPNLLKTILAGLIVWFVPDTLVTIYFGAYFNVIINIVILLAVSVPLIAGQSILKKTVT